MVPLTEQPLHIVIGKGAIAVIGFMMTMIAAILILGWLSTERDQDANQPSPDLQVLWTNPWRAPFSNWLGPLVTSWLRPHISRLRPQVSDWLEALGTQISSTTQKGRP